MIGLFLIWLLLIIAAADPVWLDEPIVMPLEGRNIMLAIDLSGSMETPDMRYHNSYLSRLTVVKDAASKFIEARKGDRVGLILFGTKAYLQTPLTFDHRTVQSMLEDATIGLAGTQTAIGDATALAIKQLLNTPKQGRILVLLTDGGNNAGSVAPLDAATIAEQQGIKIYTIGLGADQIIVQGLFGPQVLNATDDLDLTTLKKIAAITKGIFFRAEDAAQLNEVYNQINKTEPVKTDQQKYRPQKSLFPYFLGMAFLLSILAILLHNIKLTLNNTRFTKYKTLL